MGAPTIFRCFLTITSAVHVRHQKGAPKARLGRAQILVWGHWIQRLLTPASGRGRLCPHLPHFAEAQQGSGTVNPGPQAPQLRHDIFAQQIQGVPPSGQRQRPATAEAGQLLTNHVEVVAAIDFRILRPGALLRGFARWRSLRGPRRKGGRRGAQCFECFHLRPRHCAPFAEAAFNGGAALRAHPLGLSQLEGSGGQPHPIYLREAAAATRRHGPYLEPPLEELQGRSESGRPSNHVAKQQCVADAAQLACTTHVCGQGLPVHCGEDGQHSDAGTAATEYNRGTAQHVGHTAPRAIGIFFGFATACFRGNGLLKELKEGGVCLAATWCG
mmetsp:Transcript_86880/g.250666  ORF Transcript_86880/g.250666 Transcript_86880/m.250666 type:complete len:329 (-) Transcript_86880:129-1115(-)